jgi:5-methylcytosine-specific restriction endonuclease McrA
MQIEQPDPVPTRRIGGRPWRRLVAYVLTRDAGICHLCGHPGADTGDHLTPLEDGGPELDPANVRAAHGRRRTLEVDGYHCPGNYAHTRRTPPSRSTPPSRQW